MPPRPMRGRAHTSCGLGGPCCRCMPVTRVAGACAVGRRWGHPCHVTVPAREAALHPAMHVRTAPSGQRAAIEQLTGAGSDGGPGQVRGLAVVPRRDDLHAWMRISRAAPVSKQGHGVFHTWQPADLSACTARLLQPADRTYPSRLRLSSLRSRTCLRTSKLPRYTALAGVLRRMVGPRPCAQMYSIIDWSAQAYSWGVCYAAPVHALIHKARARH
jgi:hypothetical protein